MAAATPKSTVSTSVTRPAKKETFGNLGPWAEPSWYSSLASPYYNDSHKRLREVIRKYNNEEIIPHMLEWEEKGAAPDEVRLKHARLGFAFADVPEPYRPKAVPGPAGIPVAELDVFHLMVMTDENSRIEGGVGTALSGGSVIGVPPIVHHGTEEQKRKWLPGLFTWETSFCLGITEPSGGVSAAQRSAKIHLTIRSPMSPTSRRQPKRRQTGSFTSSTDTRNG
jgi:alkylation response protein AidB-like acyl-CoA dehydrogenase